MGMEGGGRRLSVLRRCCSEDWFAKERPVITYHLSFNHYQIISDNVYGSEPK